MGLRIDVKPGDPNYVATVDTTQKGASNQGHEYGTSLTDEERMALIEYLKSLQ